MLDQVTKYSNDVLENKIVTGNLVKLSCERHLNDLEKSKLAPYKYYFDIEAAESVVKFGESLKLAEKDGANVVLYGFQKFCLGSLMGWKEKETGFRRFRESNISLGRQNGKSFLNGLLGTYISNFTKCLYGQIYMVATKRDQAKIVFKEIVKFIESDEDLADLFDVKEYKSEITALNTKAIIKALSSDNKQDGLRGTLNIVDEYHLHKTADLYNMLKNGSGKLNESLTSIISTAGSNLTYPYFDKYIYSKKVLQGKITDDRIFIFICELDDDDDIWDKENYIKANPLFDKREIELMYEEGLRAKNTSERDLTDWITKKCNRWVADKSVTFLTSEIITKMLSEKTIKDFRGMHCIVGIDLSNISDLTSLSFLFKTWDDENIEFDENYFIHSHSFIPRKTFERFVKRDKNWNDYIEDLTITEACGGLRLDYKAVINYMKKLIKKYDLKVDMVAYDANNVGGILQDFDDMKLDTIAIAQSMKNLTEPTLNFEILAKTGQITFEESLLYEYCLKNAVVVQDFGENKCCKIDKRQKDRKIDPIDSTMNAFKIALAMPRPKKKVSYSRIYEKLKLN
ncbi:MAG: terminase large subunit [Sarcina sp.]